MYSLFFGFGDLSMLLVAVMGLAGGATGLPLGIPPAPEDPLMAKVAPEKCLFYTTWSGVAQPDPDSQNHVERLLAEPEVRRFISELKRRIESAAAEAAKQEGPDTQAAVEDLSKLVETVLTHPTAAFVSSAKITPSGLDVRGGLVVVVGQDAAKLKAALEKHQAAFLPGLAQAVKIGDGSWYRLQPDPHLPALTWGTRGRCLIVGIGDGAIQQILTRAYTDPPAWLAELRKRLPVDRVSTVAYFDLKATLDALGPIMGGPQLQAAIDAAGLGNAKSFGGVTGLDKQGFVSRTLLQLDGEPRGLLRAVTQRPLRPADLGPVPADAAVAITARIDAHAVFETFLSVVEKTDPRIHEYLLRDLKQMEGHLAFNLRNDLLTPLGDRWCLYASPSEGGMGIGGLTAVVSVDDRRPLADVQAKLLALAKQQMQPDEPPPASRPRRRGERIEQFTFAGQDVFYYTADYFPLAPSWCLTEKELLLSPFPQNIKAYLSRGEEFKSLATLPEVAALFPADGVPTDGGPVMLSYLDTRTLFTWLYGPVQMLAQMAARDIWREGIDLDVSLLPSAGSIGPHLRPAVSTVRRTSSGIELTNRQTFPGGNLAATVPIALTVASLIGFDSPAEMGRVQSANNLRQIAVALLGHEAAHGGFPPAYSSDPAGKPLLSWRVQILPHLGQKALYDRFKLDEPWNGPNNRPLIAAMPQVFRSPGGGAGRGMTNYLTVRGESTAFPGTEKVSLDEIARQDGAANTIMVVEVSDAAAVVWTKPDDLKYDQDDPAVGLADPRSGGFNAAFCDGSVQLIPGGISANVLKALFTRNGGEAFGRQSIGRTGVGDVPRVEEVPATPQPAPAPR